MTDDNYDERDALHALAHFDDMCTRVTQRDGGDFYLTHGHYSAGLAERLYGLSSGDVLRDCMTGRIPKALFDDGTLYLSDYDIRHVYGQPVVPGPYEPDR